MVIVIIADEIFDGVIRKEAFEFAIKLRREGFVRGKDDRRALGLFNNLGHGEGFTRARRAQQNLISVTVVQASRQFRDLGRLVARGFKFSVQDKLAPALQLWPAAHVRRRIGHDRHGVGITAGFVGLCVGHFWSLRG